MIGILYFLVVALVALLVFAMWSMHNNTRNLNKKAERALEAATELHQTLYMIASTSADPDSRTMAEAAVSRIPRKELQ